MRWFRAGKKAAIYLTPGAFRCYVLELDKATTFHLYSHQNTTPGLKKPARDAVRTALPPRVGHFWWRQKSRLFTTRKTFLSEIRWLR